MFSALGSIFSIKPRQAEQTDTRQGIQRHDPEYERRRKDKEPPKEDSFNQDNATVSVAALRVFLENFVKTSAKENAETPTTAEQLFEDEQKTASDFTAEAETQAPSSEDTRAHKNSPAAAHAASSYQNAADANEKSSVLFETTDATSGPSLDLSAADIRTIYALIEDLKTLSEANVEYLNIERADSFLESLINAVNKVKAAL